MPALETGGAEPQPGRHHEPMTCAKQVDRDGATVVEEKPFW